MYWRVSGFHGILLLRVSDWQPKTVVESGVSPPFVYLTSGISGLWLKNACLYEENDSTMETYRPRVARAHWQYLFPTSVAKLWPTVHNLASGVHPPGSTASCRALWCQFICSDTFIQVQTVDPDKTPQQSKGFFSSSFSFRAADHPSTRILCSKTGSISEFNDSDMPGHSEWWSVRPATGPKLRVKHF